MLEKAGAPDMRECDCDINTLDTKGAPLKPEELRQILAEMAHAQGEAIGLVVCALAQQIDINRLATDLRNQLAAAEKTQLVRPLAIRTATAALAALDAESALRNPKKH